MDISNILLPVVSLGGMGLLFGAGLGYASIKLKIDEDERLPLIKDALPGANCGGCGFAGCEALANAILSGDAKPNACPVGGAATAEKIADILGVTAEVLEKQVAFIKCKGNTEKAKFKYDYYGLNDCSMAAQLAGSGSKACPYGCIGAGSCRNACQFGAISMQDGIAVVDKEKCQACGMCVASCPKKLIEMVPYRSETLVSCNSNDAGKAVRACCSVGCIACKMCEKVCPADAIHVENNLAKIDYDKCTMCNACVKKCPTKAIFSWLPVPPDPPKDKDVPKKESPQAAETKDEPAVKETTAD